MSYFCLLHLLSKMDPVYSAKRSKLPLLSELHPDTYAPQLVTPSVQVKYRHIRHSLTPGTITSFNSFPHIFEIIKNVGWECLITFTDKQIYPVLIVEFYSHTTFIRDSTGTLTGISTILEGQSCVIDELLLHALHVGNNMLELSKTNAYTSNRHPH